MLKADEAEVLEANSSTDILSVGTAGVSPAESSREGVSSASSQTPDKMSGGPTGKMPVLRKSEPRDLFSSGSARKNLCRFLFFDLNMTQRNRGGQ